MIDSDEYLRMRLKTMQEILTAIKMLLESTTTVEDRIHTINTLRQTIHEYSPFKNEPVDFVRWMPFSSVVANSYNPNSVAPPEMELLKTSISQDGYTQPIVTWQIDTNQYEVVDGFHRNRVGKENQEISDRIHGHLPVVVANADRVEIGDRMASTIRHNRARGKHSVISMSDIVVELKRRNWSDDKIAKNLGMDNEEVLRLCQISGLAEMFADADFSKSWEVVDYADGSSEDIIFEASDDE